MGIRNNSALTWLCCAGTALPLGLRRSWDKSALQYETGGLVYTGLPSGGARTLTLVLEKQQHVPPPPLPIHALALRKGELLSRGIHCVHLVESYLPASILVLLEV